MKTSVILYTCLLLCIYSCKKDPAITAPVTLQGNPTVTAAADFRDTVTGNYTGTMHYVQTIFFGADTTIDTTYAYILPVAIDSSTWSNANSLWMDGIEMDANTSYSVVMNSYWAMGHPRQGASGQFILFPAYTSLFFTHSDSWQGTADIFTFQGTK